MMKKKITINSIFVSGSLTLYENNHFQQNIFIEHRKALTEQEIVGTFSRSHISLCVFATRLLTRNHSVVSCIFHLFHG